MPDALETAVVVGGSLTGLMGAIVFKALGYEVHVLERSAPSALESQAAGIRVGPEVHAFIQHYCPDHPEDYEITADAVEIVGHGGEVESKIPPKEPLRLTTWRAVYDIFMACLLKESDTPRATYRTRHVVRDVKEENGNMCVQYHNMNDNTNAAVQAKLIIAADGAHSTIRSRVYPGISPKYTGYVSWRGRVPESALSTRTREALQSRCVIHRVDGGYQISYYVPAEPDKTHSRERDFVFVWYDTLPEDFPEFRETMTDVDGRIHRTTVPRGKMQPQVWKRLLKRKASVENPAFIEVMEKIEEPFVSAIHDFQGTKGVFYDGKLLLAGDALNLCRPHGGGSTSQAAFQVQELAKCWNGEMSLSQWEKTVLESTTNAAQFSLRMAQVFWGGKVASAPAKTGARQDQ